QVAELAEETARLGEDVVELLVRQVAPEAADGGFVRIPESAVESMHGGAEVARELAAHLFGGGDEGLVADLEDLGRRVTGGGHVPAPGPGCPARIADAAELVSALGLHPEAGVRAVRDPRIVLARALLPQPSALEERADDVAAVPHDVHDPRVGIRAGDDIGEKRGLGGLLDRSHGADEPDAAGDPEGASETSVRLGRGGGDELSDGGLEP